MSQQWPARPRSYAAEVRGTALTPIRVTSHPLQIVTASAATSSSLASPLHNPLAASNVTPPALASDPLAVIHDPLAQRTPKGMVDPLSVSRSDKSVTPKKLSNELDDSDWTPRRLQILATFTTSEALVIRSIFVTESDVEQVVIESTSAASTTSRVDQLQSGSEKISAAEFVNRLSQLNKHLTQAWREERKVQAVKIAIQCSKMLTDLAVPEFYPTKFVLVTDVLDTFGRLVFQRLQSRASVLGTDGVPDVPLPEKWTSADVPEVARETALNWYYKIASIRELVPRLFMEMAILSSYRFCLPQELHEHLKRLAREIRGIGNPLTAAYARCYLLRVARRDWPRSWLSDLLSDAFATAVKADDSQAHLFTPAIAWLFSATGDANDILERCQFHSKNVIFLEAAITTLPAALLCTEATRVMRLILSTGRRAAHPTLLRAFAEATAHESTPHGEVWNLVRSFLEDASPAAFLQVAEVWVSFVARHCDDEELNELLGAAARNALPAHHLLDNLLAEASLARLARLEHFIKFLNIFTAESGRADAFKAVVRAREPGPVPNWLVDPLMMVLQQLHDTISPLTPVDERRQMSVLVTYFVKDISRPADTQLQTLAEARAHFYLLPDVMQCIVDRAIQLVAPRSAASRRAAAEIRAALAFIYVTLPSVPLQESRLRLACLSGALALRHDALGQAEAMIDFAIEEVETLPGIHFDLVLSLLSTLIAVPDNPAKPTLAQLERLCELVRGNTDFTPATMFRFELAAMQAYATLAQDRYPYHFNDNFASDMLYGGDERFLERLSAQTEDSVKAALAHVNSQNEPVTKAQCATRLCDALLSHYTSDTIRPLLEKLWPMTREDKAHSRALKRTTLAQQLVENAA